MPTLSLDPSWQDAGTGWSWGSQEPVWQAPPRPLQLRGNQEAQGSQTQGPGPPPSAGKPLASPPQSQCRWGPRTVPVTSATQLTHLGPAGLLCPGPLHTGTRSSCFSRARLRGRMRALSARRSACPAWNSALPRRGSRAPARPLLPSHGGLKSVQSHTQRTEVRADWARLALLTSQTHCLLGSGALAWGGELCSIKALVEFSPFPFTLATSPNASRSNGWRFCGRGWGETPHRPQTQAHRPRPHDGAPQLQPCPGAPGIGPAEFWAAARPPAPDDTVTTADLPAWSTALSNNNNYHDD